MLRNLAGVLGNAGKLAEAVPVFRRLVEREPKDPGPRLGLAQCLAELGGQHAEEALALYRTLKDAFPDSPVERAAVAALNRLAGERLHRAVEDRPRPDAIAYMQGAIERFAALPREAVGQIVLEIARLGQSGLAINDPLRRYRLESLPGEFSGLQLLSMMHVGVRLFDTRTDLQTGLDREYAIAAGLSDRAPPVSATLPDAYRTLIEPLVGVARAILEGGERLVPMGFVGNLATGETRQAVLNAASERAKDDSAELLRHLAALLEADFVFVIMDAWGLPADKLRRHREILERYGSIGASPYRIDVVTFSLETRHGLWHAQVPVKPKGVSKKRRTFGTPEFRLFTEAEGRFVGLLPAQEPAAGGLH